MSYLTNVPIKLSKLCIYIGFLTIILLILGCSSSQSSRSIDEPYFRELSLFRRATDLLDEGEYSQAQIAYMIGFADQSNFARAFKRWTGVSPGEFQKAA